MIVLEQDLERGPTLQNNSHKDNNNVHEVTSKSSEEKVGG